MAHIDTILVQASNGSDDAKTGAVSTPLYFSTAFRHPGLGESTGFDYARLQTPTRAILEKQLAVLEHGSDGFAVSSGMAAIDLLFSSVMHSGENFVSSDDLYGGSFRYFDDIAKKDNVSYTLWDGQDEQALADKINDKTRLVWLETPSNPTMKIIDIKKCAQAAHKKNPNIIVAVDNTFLSPIFQNPIDDGADVVVHSATKYLGGHNDILAGAVITKSHDLGETIDYNLVTRGQVLDPFSCWLLLRSLKTLHLRMARHDSNGRFLAKHLLKFAGVEKVLYPGLGGMLSFYLADGYDTDKFLKGLKVFSFAESLGGAESLITIPSIQTHHDMSQERRDQLGITDNLVRVSAGLEDQDDLLADLKQAIKGAKV
ncbi:MAG: aminotransferase class I/II-fold pyridoxal phosphate-dependent enzyme [Oenococcus sp.]|uniref:trans-sulfuration enzyme family protein n=1 Tax=Oenococcus sp. TaxID=1979414 RepID=UPI0039E95D14